MAFESLDFKYNKNHFPGVAGQGSTFILCPPSPKAKNHSFNLNLYTSRLIKHMYHTQATSVLIFPFPARNMQSPTYNKKYASSLPSLADKLASVSDSPADLLDLLRANEAFDFGSGAWFLTTQCTADVRAALQKGDQAGWERYISDCVGTSFWERAVQALGV
jgi:hypothetical protein